MKSSIALTNKEKICYVHTRKNKCIGVNYNILIHIHTHTYICAYSQAFSGCIAYNNNNNNNTCDVI